MALRGRCITRRVNSQVPISISKPPESQSNRFHLDVGRWRLEVDPGFFSTLLGLLGLGPPLQYVRDSLQELPRCHLRRLPRRRRCRNLIRRLLRLHHCLHHRRHCAQSQDRRSQLRRQCRLSARVSKCASEVGVVIAQVCAGRKQSASPCTARTSAFSLSQLPQLRVMARSTMLIYRGRTVDPRAVGRELGVNTVLTGQVIREDNIVTVRLELVHVKDGSRLWGGEYYRPMSEVFALPGDLALAVSRELRLPVSGHQQQRLTKDATHSAEAYQLYLKGRYFWNKRTAESYNAALEYFTQAVEKDPQFPLAYAGLADTYLALRSYGIRSAEETVPQAKAAAEHALRIDDTIAEAHASLASVSTHRYHSLDVRGLSR
jgi:hypothetical protein